MTGEQKFTEEQPKSTEEQVEKIQTIKGDESLGYEGRGREEHSGENAPKKPENLTDELADNSPKDRGL